MTQIIHQIAAPDLKAVPIVAIVVQVLWNHIGVVEGLVHAVLAVLVVASWCHVSTRPPTSPIVPEHYLLMNPLTRQRVRLDLFSLENSLGTVGSGPKFTPFLLATFENNLQDDVWEQLKHLPGLSRAFHPHHLFSGYDIFAKVLRHPFRDPPFTVVG